MDIPKATRFIMTDFELQLVRQREKTKADAMTKANEIVEWVKSTCSVSLAEATTICIYYDSFYRVFKRAGYTGEFKMGGATEFTHTVIDELYEAFEREFPAPGFTVNFKMSCCDFLCFGPREFWATVKWNEPRDAQVV